MTQPTQAQIEAAKKKLNGVTISVIFVKLK